MNSRTTKTMPITLPSIFNRAAPVVATGSRNQNNGNQNSPMIVSNGINGFQYSHELVMGLWQARDFTNLGLVVQKKAQTVIAARLNKTNRSGEYFMPRFEKARVIDSPNYPYVLLHLDAEAMHHFSKNDFANEDMLNALAANLRFHTFARQWNPVGGGLAYVVVLSDVPQAAAAPATPALAAPRLPRLLKYRPEMFENTPGLVADKLMVLIGAGSKGPQMAPLGQLAHTLVAGNTGSGKSNWTHAALASLLAHTSPRDVRVVLIDPKNGILAPWTRLPHTWEWDGNPAYTSEIAKADELLAAVVAEMNRRGTLRNPNPGDPSTPIYQNVDAYNAAMSSRERIPYLLVVVDEFKDLKKKAIDWMQTIVQRGRADNVLIWASSQDVSVESMPSFIKHQMSSYIVHRLESEYQSRALRCPDAHTISQQTPGRFYARGLGESATAVLMQSYFIEDQVDGLTRQMGAPQETQGKAYLPDAMKDLLKFAHEQTTNPDKLTLEVIERWSKARGRDDNSRGIERLAKSLEEDGWVIRGERNGRWLSPKALSLLGVTEGTSK
jgi:hypothetical protein